MPTLNEDQNPESLRRLKAAAYYQGAGFGSFAAFFRLVETQRLQIRRAYQRRYPWRTAVLSAQLSTLQEAFEHREFKDALDGFHLLGRPEEIFEQLAAIAGKMLGIGDWPSLRMVRHLPAPFQGRAWDALSIDANDGVRFSVPEGIYYRAGSYTFCYFEFVVAHELVHWAISKFSRRSLPFTSPLEEGICDVVALEILAQYGHRPQVLSNLLIYNRALQPELPWAVYWQASRIVASMVLADGWEELLRVLRGGRERVNSLVGGATTSRHGVHLPNSLAAIENAATVVPLHIDTFLALSAAVALQEGHVVRLQQLKQEAGLPLNTLRKALGWLDEAGWVTRLNATELFVPFEGVPSFIRYTL